MAQGNRADSVGNSFKSNIKESNDAEGVVNFKNYKSSEEKETSEMSAFEQVMSQMNIADRDDFDKEYAQLWNEASEQKESLSVVICEIDFFKEYNENYGHQGSSFMLLVIALALKTTAEAEGCYLARYKGNEFGILLKGKDVQAAHAIAEKLRLAVEKSRTEHKFSEVADYVTVSIGLSTVYPTSMQTEMRQAAIALNTAKESGFNQVCATSKPSINATLVAPAAASAEIKENKPAEFVDLMKEMKINDKSALSLHLESLWKAPSSDEELVSMLVCELDYFDDYTKHYGVEQSNDTLLVIAMALKSKCDEIDCFLSYDNNKFSIVIHGGNATKGLKVSEIIKKTLSDLKLEHLASPVKKIVTMSIGLSNIFPNETNTMNGLLSKVDSALAVAKKNGHDQLGVEI